MKTIEWPYNRSCPVIYDNDAHADVYTDELLMVMAASGMINLRGMITTSPENQYVNRETYILDEAGRMEMVRMARRSGLKNIPDPVAGPDRRLEEPTSGMIEDTLPIDTPGSRLIVEEAKKATPENPLLLVMGGPLTVAADAWLLNPSIADRMVIAWLGGNQEDMNDYNGWVDPWADYITACRLRLVQFPVNEGLPHTPKHRFHSLPQTELGRWMIDKRLPHVNKIGEDYDGDGQPVIPLLTDAYILEVKRVSFSHWIEGWHGVKVPAYQGDEKGPVTVVVCSDSKVATEAWWRVMEEFDGWKAASGDLMSLQRPFYAAPFPIGRLCRIEAGDFDRGGEGTAYHIGSLGTAVPRFREEAVDVIEAGDVPGGYNIGSGGGYCVAGLKAGDWIKYSLEVINAGMYEIGIRVFAAGRGRIRLSFDGGAEAREVSVPVEEGTGEWMTVISPEIELPSGFQILKVLMEGGLEGEFAAKLHYFTFALRNRI